MSASISLRPALATIGPPMLLILLTTFIALTPSLFNLNPSVLSLAITIDLAFSIPVLYLLLIRNRGVPRITGVPLFIGGLFLATALLPEEELRFANLLKEWLLPVAETVVITLIAFKVRRARIEYRTFRGMDIDVVTALREASRRIIPGKIGRVFAGEIALFYYCFFAWRRPILEENMFTSHKENGTIALLAALVLAIMVEATAVHLLIGQWSETAAWIFTALSFYCVLQVLGLIKSIPRRPIRLDEHMISLRNGVFAETTIDPADIERIERVAKDSPIDSRSVRKLSLFSHNMLIHLKSENAIEGLYGMKKTYRSLALYVDDSRRFESILQAVVKRRTEIVSGRLDLSKQEGI